MTNETIRPYGPGKFNTILDSYVYQVSLDGGCDDELGSVSENGSWYGLMRHGRTIFRDHDPMLETLNAVEQEALTSAAGVIVYENSDGFVSVDYFDTEKELDSAWDEIQREFDENANAAQSDEEDEEPEPDDDSITTSDHETFYQYGKVVFTITERSDNKRDPVYFEMSLDLDRTFASIDRAIAWALDVMQFWPNVFFVSDHGNAHLIKYWEGN